MTYEYEDVMTLSYDSSFTTEELTEVQNATETALEQIESTVDSVVMR